MNSESNAAVCNSGTADFYEEIIILFVVLTRHQKKNLNIKLAIRYQSLLIFGLQDALHQIKASSLLITS